MSLSGCQSYAAVLFSLLVYKIVHPFSISKMPLGFCLQGIASANTFNTGPSSVLRRLAKLHSRIFNEGMLVTKYP